MKIKDLQPAEYNPRNITDKKLEMLGKAMAEFGDLSGIVYNIRTQRMIGGHQRIKHLHPDWEVHKEPRKDEVGTVAVGFIQTPNCQWQYREVDWDEQKEIAANIAANKHGGDFDFPKLKDLIVAIDDGGIDIELTGFEQGELEDVFGRVVSMDDDEKSEDVERREMIKCPKCGFEI